jgi:AcrR family transcriptional regulator
VSTASAESAPRRRRARGSISAEEISDGAYDLAARESLDALSMPRLAQRLDVGVTSIYWYFRNKDDLLHSLGERAMAEFVQAMSAVAVDVSWEKYVWEYFAKFRQIFIENSLLCDLLVVRGHALTPTAARMSLELINHFVGVLVDAGLSPDDAWQAYATLSVYTRGSVFLARRTYSGEPPHLNPSSMNVPELAVLASLHGQPDLSMASEEDFRFGIDNIVRGLRALIVGERDETHGRRRSSPAKEQSGLIPVWLTPDPR